MKIDVSERMSVAFIWNTSQDWDGYPVSLPFRALDNLPFIYTHQANSITGDSDAGMIELETTWNTTGEPSAIWMNITDTASAPTSKIFEFLVNGVVQSSLSKDGVFFAKSTASGHIVPQTDNTYNLGAPALRWAQAYIATLIAGSATFAGGVTFNGPVVFNSTVSGQITADSMHITGDLVVDRYTTLKNTVYTGSASVPLIQPDGRIPAVHPAYFQDTTGVYMTGVGLLGSPNAWASRQDFTAYSEEHTAIAIIGGGLTIDMALGSVFEFTYNQAIGNTVVTSVPVSGKYGSFCLIINTAGSFSWPWFTSIVHWPGGGAPVITAAGGRIDKYFFFTRNGGATWHGSVVGQNYAP
jgi:hypothetical protein